MKRIQIRPGKFVTVSTALAEKAERIFASTAMSREEAERIAQLEPRGTAIFAGKIDIHHRARAMTGPRRKKAPADPDQ